MDDKVIISVTEFEELIWNRTIFEVIVSALKNSAVLDYTGNALMFHDDELVNVFKSVLPSTYANLLTRLQDDKQMDGDK